MKQLKMDKIKIPNDLDRHIKKCGFTAEHVFNKMIERAMWKTINAYTRNRCDKCGKVGHNRTAAPEEGHEGAGRAV